MGKFAGHADRTAIEAEMPWDARDMPRTMHRFMGSVAQRFPSRPAITFQLLSGPKDRADTLTWAQFHSQSTQAANMFRAMGVGPKDVVAYLLPNCLETAVTLIGGTIAGIANPINPLLAPAQIAAILRETGATVLVTLKAFPKTDVPQKAAEAVKLAPNVKTVLEVDLNHYLTPPKRWIVPFIRPKNPVDHHARVLQFRTELAKYPGDHLTFDDPDQDRVAAYFHTGGTTGMPKVAQHRISGMVYNGWLGHRLLFSEKDNVICPLPLFHVFACHVILMAMISSGGHVVFPTPAGYRGDGVFDNFWKLVERWKISFVITVPTAIAALMQRPVDADVSSIKQAFSGSSPLPVELYKRFEKATGVAICEGYGLTEATCLVSINPVDGIKKIGSVGIPFPYCGVKILVETPDGMQECETDAVGEICVSNPGVYAGSTYTEVDKNNDLFHDDIYLRTGDLGRIDSDGYIWITGRAKDVIIRGGHNIDPAEIEEALAGHPDVAMAGAIGQPDAFAGELPCAYVELVADSDCTVETLIEHARQNVRERAARPKYIEIIDEMPKTAVGKVFKPELRRRAITRVFNAALEQAGIDARVADVREDRKRGLVAYVARGEAGDQGRVAQVLGEFATPWDWAD
ncbi:acyl-CoA synthetase [Oceaniglobus ichthyenteri]|uniref:acyl-CoA synthetase n=1 Tax=Oceaniglobus ichthyenteri TaxID=2136177 RepID=UPI000D38399A|nr:acyl-CoA synthetase [Oceaniglobus ichthyenteri]